VGKRVRLKADGIEGRVVGTVQSVDPGAVRLKTAGGAQDVPYRSIRRVEMYIGEGSKAAEMGGYGFVLGAAAGYALSAASPGTLRWGRMTQPEANLVGAAIVGPLGAIIGAAIGSGTKTEEWKEVEWRGVTFDLRPAPGQIAVRLRW
jgi:hypothetical protein